MQPHSTNPCSVLGDMLIISFGTDPAHAQIIQSRVGLCIQRKSGSRTRRTPSAEPYCARLFKSFSWNIRWPSHFVFLSCSMMNEVSGARCFLVSSSRTSEARLKSDSHKNDSVNHPQFPPRTSDL